MFPPAASFASCTGELEHAIREAVHGRDESRPALCCCNVNQPKQERQTAALCFTLTHSTVAVLTEASHKIYPSASEPELQQSIINVLLL